MKKQKRFLVYALAASLILLFSFGSANAAWMSNATIDEITVTADGNYTLKATSGAWTKYFTILSTDANANAILAVLLTAQSSGTDTITILYTGSNIDAVYL